MSETAVLVVDMLNAYQHPDADLLSPNVADIIDNYGDFTADYSDILRSALHGRRPDLVKPIAPTEGCRILSKVRHSAFYPTADHHGSGHRAMPLDAYVRHFSVVVPPDAVAHIDAELGQAALTMMRKNMTAELTTAADCLG